MLSKISLANIKDNCSQSRQDIQFMSPMHVNNIYDFNFFLSSINTMLASDYHFGSIFFVTIHLLPTHCLIISYIRCLKYIVPCSSTFYNYTEFQFWLSMKHDIYLTSFQFSLPFHFHCLFIGDRSVYATHKNK